MRVECSGTRVGWMLLLALLGCREREPAKLSLAPLLSMASPGAEAAPPPSTPPRPGSPLAELLPSLAPMVNTVKGAVVNVEVRARALGRAPPMREPWGPFFGGPELPPGPRVRQGLGSGVIIAPRGLVLTNHHVVADAVDIRVRLDGGREFGAKVLGRDPLTDIALVQLQGEVKDLPTARLGDSEAVQVGDWVVAIGNPFGLASSVSIGVLSAKARDIGVGPYDDFLQTDAAINPGNSGGPLFNLRGEVVGINTAIVGEASGIGFAVPSSLALALLPQLEKEGRVTRGWLGVSVQELTPELAQAMGLPVQKGAIVLEVTRGTPAAKAGLAADDVIVGLNGKALPSAAWLTRALALERPGTEVSLEVLRGGQRLRRQVKLAQRPDFEGVGREEAQAERPSRRPEGLGLTLTDVNPRLARRSKLPSQGALVTAVAPGSVAERADLEPGMVVVEAAGKPVRSAEELAAILEAQKPGARILLRVQRTGVRELRALQVPG